MSRMKIIGNRRRIAYIYGDHFVRGDCLDNFSTVLFEKYTRSLELRLRRKLMTAAYQGRAKFLFT